MKKKIIIGILFVLAVILFFMALPAVIAYRSDRPVQCWMNLRNIQYGKESAKWKYDFNNGDVIQKSKVAEFFNDGFPSCPNGGTYIINPIGQFPECTKGCDSKVTVIENEDLP
jgi:hypothetical protein